MRTSATKRALITAGTMLGLLLLQGTLLNRLTLWGARPDLVLVVVGSVALVRGWGEGLLWGAVGGFFEDMLSGSLLGSHALTKSITGFALGLVEGKVFKENPLLPAVALFAGTLVDEVLFFLAAGAFGQIEWAFVTVFIQVILPTATLTAFFAPFLYRYLADLHAPLGLSRRERSRA